MWMISPPLFWYGPDSPVSDTPAIVCDVPVARAAGKQESGRASISNSTLIDSSSAVVDVDHLDVECIAE
jgi:hypothetical protein